MKKRSKLVISISALCLVISLLVFGVWAATTLTYNGTMSIAKYSFDHSLCKVTRTIYKYKSTNNAIAEATATTLTSNTDWTQVATASFQTYKDGQQQWTNPTAPSGMTWSGSTMSDPYTFDFNTSFLYKVKITITQTNLNGSTFAFSVPASSVSNAYCTVASSGNTATGTKITTNTATLVYFIGIKDMTTAISTSTLNTVTVSMTRVA